MTRSNLSPKAHRISGANGHAQVSSSREFILGNSAVDPSCLQGADGLWEMDERASALATKPYPIDMGSIGNPLAVVPGWLTIRTLPSQTLKYRLIKRIFDLILAVLIFPLVALAGLIIGALIMVTTGGPIFYRQTRIGQYGRKFKIMKFRTMHPRAEKVLLDFLDANPTAHVEWLQTHKLKNDPRITALGRFLRKTSLDELPQIFNVFCGDMSFVGPRPIVHAEREKYGERFVFYTAVVPGITGLWQVSGRCDVSYAARVALDERYARTWAPLLDLRILLRTPRAVFRARGAY